MLTITLIGVVIAALTLVVTWVGFRISSRLNHLDHEFVSGARLLSDDAVRLPNGLEVRYQGEMVANPYLQIVRLINVGPRAIREEDFRMPIQIEFGAPVIAVHVTKTNPLEIEPRVRKESTKVFVEPMLFNRRDWIALSILTDGEPTERADQRVWVRAVNTAESRPFRVPTRENWPMRVSLVAAFICWLPLWIAEWGVIYSNAWRTERQEDLHLRWPLPEWVVLMTWTLVFAVPIAVGFATERFMTRRLRQISESYQIL